MRVHAAVAALLLAVPVAGAAEDDAITIDHWGSTTLVVSAPELEQDPAVLRQLKAEVTLDLQDAPLMDVATFLAHTEGINVVIQPALLTAEPHVTLKVQHMGIEHVLHWVCELAHCHWAAVNGTVYLSEQPVQGPRHLVFYDVADMLAPVRDFPGPELAFAATGGASENGGMHLLQPVNDPKQEAPSIDQVEDMLRKLLGATSP